MIYPCNCPLEPDGGIARRAAFVKTMRKEYPNTVLLDSGGFFAGGLMDEYTQNTTLDMQRTEINLKGMELMKYDAVAVGDDEFNFGKDYFLRRAGVSAVPFLSCNLVSDKVVPYVIKEVAGVKIGIIGLTGLSVLPKAGGLDVLDPREAVSKAVTALKGEGVTFIILLSHQGENQDMDILEKVPGINILIVGHSRSKDEMWSKYKDTLILRPSRQARRVGRVLLRVNNGKVTRYDYDIEEVRMSDKIMDDPQVAFILPTCFSDMQCKKKDSIGTCQNPGKKEAKCVFAKAPEIRAWVIVPRGCSVCNPSPMINLLKKEFCGCFYAYLYGCPGERTVEEFSPNKRVAGIPVG